MKELKFILMHRADPVCALTIDATLGSILRVAKANNPELLPLGGNMDSAQLRKWWQNRAVPMGQGRIKRILESAGIPSAQAYLVKNWGLSLTDHYWIKPLDFALGWEQINLFTNDFVDPVGELQFSETIGGLIELPANAFSPSSSLQGELRKKWIIRDGKRYLVKGNHGNNSQESLNETVATLLHAKQSKQPYVHYSPMHTEQDNQIYCVCESFTSEKLELISAYEVIESQKKPNSLSAYEHFIQVCAQHGLPEERTRPFLEYQIVTDFILSNTDRHLRNIGVLRDTDTLQFVGVAPIFDTGNSMFYRNPLLPRNDDLRSLEVNSFRTREMDLLKYVQGNNLVDPQSLPAGDEIACIYDADPLISYADSLLLGYQKKIDILCESGML